MADPGDAAKTLEGELQGELIRPGDGAYDGARSIWNGMIDRRPALIARCASPEDVAAAVRFAVAQKLPLGVRGGGHGVAGLALAEDGLVVDLSAMREVQVDASAGTVRAQGGATLADLDGATQEHGLAAPLGVVTKTGIAGLTLSGGIGWLRRKHGLSIDSLVEAEVVTAGAEVLTASAERNEDLFWALRGGGGNFGVVTSFTYRAHPIGPEVFFCFVLYPAARAGEVLRACRAAPRRKRRDDRTAGRAGSRARSRRFPRGRARRAVRGAACDGDRGRHRGRAPGGAAARARGSDRGPQRRDAIHRGAGDPGRGLPRRLALLLEVGQRPRASRMARSRRWSSATRRRPPTTRRSTSGSRAARWPRSARPTRRSPTAPRPT